MAETTWPRKNGHPVTVHFRMPNQPLRAIRPYEHRLFQGWTESQKPPLPLNIDTPDDLLMMSWSAHACRNIGRERRT